MKLFLAPRSYYTVLYYNSEDISYNIPTEIIQWRTLLGAHSIEKK